MEGPVSVHSLDELFLNPALTKSRFIEVNLSDAIHFRLVEPLPVFQFSELRLAQRQGDRFTGFAKLRNEIELSMRSASIEEKIAACCTRRTEWRSSQQVLFSTELEVWMDLSYPNPWAADLYRRLENRDQEMTIEKSSYFPPLFTKLLLQKNGYERLARDPAPEATLRLNLGPPYTNDPAHINLRPSIPQQRPHPFSGSEAMADRLACGVIARDREEQVFLDPNPKARYVHDIGFRLLGPTLVLLLQALKAIQVPTGFVGIGSGFMTTLGQSLRHSWPWLPPVVEENKASHRLSLLPNPNSSLSLLPSASASPSLLNHGDCSPLHLLLPPMETFLLAATRGQHAPRLQSSASAFVVQLARLSRGLHLPLSSQHVLQHWRQQVLSPNSDMVRVLFRERILPDFRRARSPWEAKRQCKEGRWPTGSYMMSKGYERQWVRMMAPQRARSIERWHEALKPTNALPL